MKKRKDYSNMRLRKQQMAFLTDRNLEYVVCGFEVVDATLWFRFRIYNSVGWAVMQKTVGRDFITFDRSPIHNLKDDEMFCLEEDFAEQIYKDKNFIKFYKDIIGEDLWVYEKLINDDIYAGIYFEVGGVSYTTDENDKIIEI